MRPLLCVVRENVDFKIRVLSERSSAPAAFVRAYVLVDSAHVHAQATGQGECFAASAAREHATVWVVRSLVGPQIALSCKSRAARCARMRPIGDAQMRRFVLGQMRFLNETFLASLANVRSFLRRIHF